MALYFYSIKLKVGSIYQYLTWYAFENQVRKSQQILFYRGRNRAVLKNRGKLGKFGGRPTKLPGQPAMYCVLPALASFPSSPYTSRKYMVMLGHAVMVGKLW
jgi:hypothetical protein